MKIPHLSYLTLIVIIFSIYTFAQSKTNDNSQFLTWNNKTTISKGASWLAQGRVGGFFDGRVLETNKSYNYKLRATLMAPEAIRAAARMEQLRSRLTDDETRSLVSQAEQENLVIIIEIDPREGSGVIPNDWRAFIHSKYSSANESIRGLSNINLKSYKALQ